MKSYFLNIHLKDLCWSLSSVANWKNLYLWVPKVSSDRASCLYLFSGYCWGQFSNIQQPTACSCDVGSLQHLGQADIHPADRLRRWSAAALTGQTSQHREWLCPRSSLPPAGGPHGETEPCEFCTSVPPDSWTCFPLLWLEKWDCNVFSVDRGEPNGHDQLPRGVGKDAGDRGAASEEESEEGGGAVFAAPGVKHLWSVGLHRLRAHRIGPRIRGSVRSTDTIGFMHWFTQLQELNCHVVNVHRLFSTRCPPTLSLFLLRLSNSWNIRPSVFISLIPHCLSNYRHCLYSCACQCTADRFLGTGVVAIVTVRAAAPNFSQLTPPSMSQVCCQGNVSSSQQFLDHPLFQFPLFVLINL